MATDLGTFDPITTPQKVISIIQGQQRGFCLWDVLSDQDRVLWLAFRGTLPIAAAA